MRSELMRVFDKIYILDLHGNTRKKETAPDGSKDENVFDIMQGVSINIFVKKSGKSKAPAEVRHFDLYGLREYKYEFLRTHNFGNVEWQKLEPKQPHLFFVPKNFGVQEEYEKGFGINELMKKYSGGIESGRDELFIGNSKEEVVTNVREVFDNNQVVKDKYGIFEDSSFKLLQHIKEVKFYADFIRKIDTSPFNTKVIYYDKYLLRRAFYDVFQNMLSDNLCLCVPRQTAIEWRHALVSSNLLNGNFIAVGRQNGAGQNFPLYLYPEPGSIDSSRRPNLDEHIWAQINAAIGKDTAPEDIFDYIYGVLHSPAYRARFKEFLKVDFPRIPYPKDQTEFEHFRSFGTRLRELHLMHSVPESLVSFPESGSMSVEKVEFSLSSAPGVSAADVASIAPELNAGRVYINATQYFANVPRTAWEFYIGGYQPAQKWLKDRKGRTLSFDDISHYGKIISVLTETARLMTEIDNTP